MAQNKKNVIKQKFSTLIDMVYQSEREVIDSLKTELERNGEQNILYYDDDKVVPITYLNESGDSEGAAIDKIRIENGIVEIHEVFDDEWFPLEIIDMTAALILISYIDWKK